MSCYRCGGAFMDQRQSRNLFEYTGESCLPPSIQQHPSYSTSSRNARPLTEAGHQMGRERLSFTKDLQQGTHVAIGITCGPQCLTQPSGHTQGAIEQDNLLTTML